MGMLDCRTDFQNLPTTAGVRWPTAGYGTLGGDWSGYRFERAEILNFIKRKKITGLVSIAGDRHSFFAGLLSASLPPKPFEPVGVEFITGSISAPGIIEALSYSMAKDNPIRPIFLYEPPGAPVQPAMNFSVLHGVRSSLTLFRTGDRSQALADRNAEVSPHLSFVDLGGHGYSVVRAESDALEVEFVCIPRPLERSERADGGPQAYRITHRVKLWNHANAPRVERTALEGSAPSIL